MTKRNAWTWARAARWLVAGACIGLGGCASCNLFSRSTVCDAQLVGLAVVTAPVLVPYAMVQNAREEHQWKARVEALKQAVEAGDLDASFQALMRRYDATPTLRLQAARQLLAAPLPAEWAPGRQQAALFLAHRFRAPTAATQPDGLPAEDWLAAARAGAEPSLWALVRLKDNGLPVDNTFFQSEAREVARRVMRQRQAARAQAAADDTLPFECDARGLEPMLVLSERGPDAVARVCRLAQLAWERERAQAGPRRSP